MDVGEAFDSVVATKPSAVVDGHLAHIRFALLTAVGG